MAASSQESTRDGRATPQRCALNGKVDAHRTPLPFLFFSWLPLLSWFLVVSLVFAGNSGGIRIAVSVRADAISSDGGAAVADGMGVVRFRRCQWACLSPSHRSRFDGDMSFIVKATGACNRSQSNYHALAAVVAIVIISLVLPGRS